MYTVEAKPVHFGARPPGNGRRRLHGVFARILLQYGINMSCTWKERNDVASFVRNLPPDLDLARLVRPEQSGLHSERAVCLEG